MGGRLVGSAESNNVASQPDSVRKRDPHLCHCDLREPSVKAESGGEDRHGAHQRPVRRGLRAGPEARRIVAEHRLVDDELGAHREVDRRTRAVRRISKRNEFVAQIHSANLL
eukprot:3208177-Prymnesium_polylepis.1